MLDLASGLSIAIVVLLAILSAVFLSRQTSSPPEVNQKDDRSRQKPKSSAVPRPQAQDEPTQMEASQELPLLTPRTVNRVKQKEQSRTKRQEEKVSKAVRDEQKLSAAKQREAKKQAEKDARLDEQARVRRLRMLASMEQRRDAEREASEKKAEEDTAKTVEAIARKLAIDAQESEARRLGFKSHTARLAHEEAEKEKKRRAALQASMHSRAKAEMAAKKAAQAHNEKRSKSKAAPLPALNKQKEDVQPEGTSLTKKPLVPRINLEKLRLGDLNTPESHSDCTRTREVQEDAWAVNQEEQEDSLTTGSAVWRNFNDVTETPRSKGEADMAQWIRDTGTISGGIELADVGTANVDAVAQDAAFTASSEPAEFTSDLTPLWRVLDDTQTPRSMAEVDMKKWIQEIEGA